GRVRRWRVADRILIDVDDFVDVLQAEDVVVGRGSGAGAVQTPRQRQVQHLVDQRTLSATADAGDGDKGAQREGYVDVLQVVLSCALDREPGAGRRAARLTFLLRLWHAAMSRHGDRFLSGQILSG